MPHLKELHERWADKGLVILGVHTQSKGELAHEFARKEGIPYPICIDSSGQTVKRFKVNSFPDYYLVDREGVLRYADLANGEVDRVLEELLTERKDSPFAAALRAFGARHPRVGLAAGEGEGRGETLVQLSFGRDGAGSWIEVEARSQDPDQPARLEVSRMRLEKGLPLLRHRVFEDGAVQWDLTCEKGKLKGKGPMGSVLRNLEAWPTSPLAPLLLSGPLASAERTHRESGGIGASRELVRWLSLGRELRVVEGQLEARSHPTEVSWVGVGWFPNLAPLKAPQSVAWFDEDGALAGLEAGAGAKQAIELMSAESTAKLAERLLDR